MIYNRNMFFSMISARYLLTRSEGAVRRSNGS